MKHHIKSKNISGQNFICPQIPTACSFMPMSPMSEEIYWVLPLIIRITQKVILCDNNPSSSCQADVEEHTG